MRPTPRPHQPQSEQAKEDQPDGWRFGSDPTACTTGARTTAIPIKTHFALGTRVLITTAHTLKHGRDLLVRVRRHLEWIVVLIAKRHIRGTGQHISATPAVEHDTRLRR
jgi:hypothetical protein